MNTTLKRLRKIRSGNCITIALNTHRTHPDTEKDAIVLKNLVAEAAERLAVNTDNNVARTLTEKLETLAKSVDHRANLDSLLLFVNMDIAEMVRLSIPVTDRVVFGDRFATRDLLHSTHLETRYFILVLNKDEAKLIEARNDQAIRESVAPFPIQNADHSKTFSAQSKDTNRTGALISEFFNFVDKEVNKVRKEDPLPVLICSDESNFYEYLKIADQQKSILPEFLNRSRQNEKPNAIVADAWPILQQYTQNKNDVRISELLQAVNQQKFLSDTNDISRAITEGRVQTLFLEHGLHQSAANDQGQINDEIAAIADSRTAIDDIYEDLIGRHIDSGGDVVLLPQGTLPQFNGLGAVTRY